MRFLFLACVYWPFKFHGISLFFFCVCSKDIVYIGFCVQQLLMARTNFSNQHCLLTSFVFLFHWIVVLCHFKCCHFQLYWDKCFNTIRSISFVKMLLSITHISTLRDPIRVLSTFFIAPKRQSQCKEFHLRKKPSSKQTICM